MASSDVEKFVTAKRMLNEQARNYLCFNASNKTGWLIAYFLRKAWNDSMARARYTTRFEEDEKLNLHRFLAYAVGVGNFDSAWEEKDKQYLLVAKSEKDFDVWHRKVCEALCQKTDNRINIGVSQKFVNMFFKYLYCMHEYEFSVIDARYFAFCHMPLDSIIIDYWYRQCVDTEVPRFTWNGLEDYSKYLAIQKKIRNYCTKSPLSEEFSVWEDAKERKNAQGKTVK